MRIDLLLSTALILGTTACPGGGPSPTDAGVDFGPVVMIGGTRQIVTGAVSLMGVTSDDRVVYHDDDKGGIYAVSLDGTAPTTIDAQGDSASISGPVVFSWSNLDPNADLADLTVWTAAQKVPWTLVRDSLLSSFAASADGTRVLYTASATADGLAELWIASLDGAFPPQKLLGDFASATRPHVLDKHFLLQYRRGGDTTSRLGIVDFDTVQLRELFPRIVSYSVAASGKQAFIAEANGAGVILTIADGTTRQVVVDASYGYLLADGATLVYRTSLFRLKRVGLDGRNGVFLATPDANSLGAFAGDEQHVFFRSSPTGGAADQLWLASTQSANAVQLTDPSNQPLNGAVTGAVAFTGFTRDSMNLWFTVNPDTYFNGTLYAAPVSGNAARRIAERVRALRVLDASRFLYGDNYLAVPKSIGRYDVLVADLASGAPPTIVATQVEATVDLNAARDHAVYALRVDPAHQGIYVAPLQ